MSTTAQQVFNIAMDLIEERLDDGTISTSDTVSYNVKSPGILTVLQAELLKPGEIFDTYQISNKPIDNLLGSQFDIRAFEGDELTFECSDTAKAYYFEVDNDATVYVEDYTSGWNTLATVSPAPTESGFTAYSGLVTPTSGATKSRLRFTGSYYYRIVNRALFGVAFASTGDIPVYRPWVKKQMPTDFKTLDELIVESNDEYSKSSGYKWEGKRDLYISYFFDGNIRVIYHPVPSMVTALSETLEVDDVTARTVMPYGLAAQLMLQENPAIASFFNGRYEELKRGEKNNQPASWEDIENVYGGFD